MVTEAELSEAEEIPSDLTRAEVQEYVFEKLFPNQGELISEYQFDASSNGIKR